MPKKSVKPKSTSNIQNELKEIIEENKTENQALHKLLQFIEKASKGKNIK